MQFKRWACEQVDPGDADPHPGAKGLILAMDAMPPARMAQARRFAAASGERITLYELTDPDPTGYRLYQS